MIRLYDESPSDSKGVANYPASQVQVYLTGMYVQPVSLIL